MSSLPKGTREIKEEYNKWHSKVISGYYDRKLYQWLKKQANLFPTETVLDVGCGKGDWLNFLEPTKSYRVGIDISLVALKHARRAAISANIDYVLADAKIFPLKNLRLIKFFA